MTLPPYDTLETDVLILGSGGAGLCAALHLADARPAPRVLMAVKGLFGKSGCTRMVQGGYNVVLRQPDSLEAHFRDTVSGGQWLNDQELAWLLVKEAPGRVLELENRAGCFFDRNPDGTVHQKPFAGQTHDRTVHKGDLTGIEIVNRLSEQVAATPNTTVLEEVRAVELLQSHGGGRIVGALLLDQRTGRFVAVNARATLLATGGGPTMYRIAAPCHDKTCDGIAMAWRAGATLMDMEMVQFHPTGLLAANAQITGTVLEEGLRGAGAHLRNALGERFMGRYDAREERATRDVVSRSSYMELMAGRGTPEGGVWLDISHLGADFVLKNFRGMTLRCRDVGYDLATEPVLVSPTAHFLMGGVVIDTQCRAGLEGLYVAGEDAGGVHGANRLGGNGVAESTVFGGLAGDVIAARLPESPLVPWDASHVALAMEHCLAPFRRGEAPPVYPLRERLRELMWVKAGLVRDAAQLAEAAAALAELREGWRQAGVPGGPAYNLAWMDWLNLENWLDACETIVAGATARSESRGSHYRSDHPQHGGGTPYNLLLRRGEATERRPVRFTRLRPDGAA
jgi:succinate dehydrogenase/fumarate reductase flavoprotein subunit